jgi:hypothetical protein
MFDRWGKSSGLSQEIQANDTAFDKDFYIDTESHEIVKAWIKIPEVREAVINLFRLGIKEIECNFGTMTAQGPKVLQTLGLGRMQIEAIARNLLLLKEELEKSARNTKPEPVGVGAMPRYDASKLRVPRSATWITTSILIVPLILGFLMTFINQQNFCIPIYGAGDYITKSWPYWSSSVLLFGVYLFPVLKGHSKAHESFLALIVFALITHVFAMFSIYEYVNFANDKSQPRVHQLNLLQAYDRKPERGSDGDSVIRLSPVELGGSDLHLTLPYNPGMWDMRRIQGAQLTVRDGYLGIPYAIEVVPIRRDAPFY